MAAGLTAPELRELSADELATRLRESKEELFNLRFQLATGQLDNPTRMRVVRHEVARTGAALAFYTVFSLAPVLIL